MTLSLIFQCSGDMLTTCCLGNAKTYLLSVRFVERGKSKYEYLLRDRASTSAIPASLSPMRSSEKNSTKIPTYRQPCRGKYVDDSGGLV